MDFMDIDQIEEVPDTPERFITSCNKSNKDGSNTENNSNGSSSCRVIDRDYFNQKLRNESREKGKSVIFNGGRRLFVKPDNIGNSSSSKNVVENTHHDKGKSLSNATSFVDLTEGSSHNHINKLDPRSDTGKRVAFGGQQKGENGSSSLAITPPRVNRHKRLVRNGCISPHNIAKTKAAEKRDVSSVSHVACDGPSSKVEIKDIVSETTDSHRLKGKGVSNHPSAIEKHDSRNTHLAQRRPLLFKDATDASTESDGWITTHSTLKNGRSASSSVNDQSKNAKVHTSHINRSNFCNHYEALESAQSTKRQKEGVGSSNIRGCDTAYVNNADMASSSVIVGSLTSRSTRNKNRHASSSSDEGGNRGSLGDEDSAVRALQLEEDERLARELQEQLYNEVPAGFGVDEMDSHHALAMAMQQEHSLHAGGHGLHAGGRAASHLRSHASRSHASRSVSSNNRTQASASTRLARLRGRFPGRPRTISARRSSIFPPNMDVDMRMQILEALEAFNDMELPTNLLQMGREFNENDYEMLALDDNNHQHGGATHAQINNLPQSTAQVENLEECAICLETPNVGETIRHLPCLHKFHKDCIDEWLRRKTSCPVCKSSIT